MSRKTIRRFVLPTLTIAGLLAILCAPHFQDPAHAARRTGSQNDAALRGRVLLPDGGSANASTVIWLEAPGLHGTPLRRAIMDQKEKTFLPHILVITPGTQVHFWNHDTVFHNVFAQFEAKKFDLGVYPTGSDKTQTFNKAGVVSVLCNIHPRMSAFVLIVDTPYFATADKKGAFELRGVPAGSYTLHVWHESGAEATQPCVVPAADSRAALTVGLKPR